MEFTPGLALAESYYHGAVRPLLDRHYPGLRHAAALLGEGSEVLGFDTERSRDHNWGPRMQLFVADQQDAVTATLHEHLPATWHGHPTVFVWSLNPDDEPRHQVHVVPLRSWWHGLLGLDPGATVTTHDWLATPTQRLAEVTAGRVFHDGPGDLTAARRALRWYPDDVWRYVLACQWRRIAQEEAFPGRCAEVGDLLGSAVVTARLVRDMMRLALLMHRRYPPYSKWLGTAFARLELGDLQAHLSGALSTPDWPAREDRLAAAYRVLAVRQNELGLAEPVEETVRYFYDRPFRVLDADRFVATLRAAVTAPQLRRLPLSGAVDQFVDNTDALSDSTFTRRLVQPA
jgi:hypothetical protein